MSAFSAIDHAHMARALRLAELGMFTTRPNPQVGCVIARDAVVLGEGWHQRAGQPHAEVFALRVAGAAARGATAYVTLEPCAHHGRTPPCVDALIAAGLARVVVAQCDPFAEVNGRGIERLRAAGIKVEVGLLQQAARTQIRGFLARIERRRPWLRVKLAMSLDGCTALASGESKWITSPAARQDVQRWRARADAILTGAGTLRADDPALTARVDAPVTPPVRVVVMGKDLTLSPALRLLGDGAAPTLIVHPEGHRPRIPATVESLALPATHHGVDLHLLCEALATRGIGEVHVEAGARLSGALWAAGLVDELLIYQAPVLLGEGGRPLLAGLSLASMAERQALTLLESRQVGDDLRLLLRAATAAPHPMAHD